MPQLLLEILSEEIPARMQAKAEADLVKALMDRLTAAGLMPEGIKGFSGPRRLVAVVEGLPVKSADVVEDIKGPKVGAPDAAIQGFMKKAGLKDISEAHVHEDKKGQMYVAHVRKPGRETASLIAEMVPAIIRDFHWPKSMRWGSGDLRWVRPISRILCTFDGEVVPFEIEGIKSDNLTEGHRVMGRGPFKVRRFEDYEDVLKNKGFVTLDREERKEIILSEAKTLCQAQTLELVEDQGLLEEVAGLAEHPVVLIGDMDKAFLDLPPEVIKLSMRTHQKYFAVRDPSRKDGGLAPKFIVVANLDASDGGEKIAAGNARVLSARLNDARFFWDNDRKIKLEERFDKLEQVVFHKRLGTLRDRAWRLVKYSAYLAPLIHADSEKAKRAAELVKCDLVSEMVGEFAELEGTMGRYYALAGNESAEIAEAIKDHYRPKGPGDSVPTAATSAVVALADKFDLLTGLWAANERPTGSKDPFALRRAALGIIRIVLENNYRLRLKDALQRFCYEANGMVLEYAVNTGSSEELALLSKRGETPETLRLAIDQADAIQKWFDLHERVGADVSDLLAFFADRLKVHLREQGARHDLIDAVFALGEDDLVLIVKRVESLGAFLDTEDGKNLLAGYKRAANILRAEEKKEGAEFSGEADPKLFEQPEEKALHAALAKAAPDASSALNGEDFSGAMSALSKLRGPVDAFFDKVTVNSEKPDIRLNRLRLLSQIRDALGRVADFSKIEG
ncbi:MAG: glycine--tRNA ligase subunit beta [Alphaproteobacteria bacterium]|nr:glycine--tRNA ligase subunit beta [Alphaproteobacteria bacterium]